MTLLSDTDRQLIDGLRAGVCTGPGPCQTDPIGEGKNWVTKVAGLPLYIRAIAHALIRSGHSESEAIQLAVGTVKRWAAGGGKVSAETRARAAKALAEWEAKKAAAHGSRDAGPVTEGGSAGSLLPVGPSPKTAKNVEAKLALANSDGRHPHADVPHAFRGRDLAHCAVCGLGINAAIHQSRRARSGRRHAGPGHAPVPTGHVKDNPVRRRVAHKKQFVTDADRIEPHLQQAMAALFDRQAKRTLSALNGNRGRRIRAMVRAAQPPDQPAEPDGTQPPAAPEQPAPDAQAIFDLAFWTDQTAKAAQPILDQAGQASVARVGSQLGIDTPARSSLDAVDQVLADRANRLAGQVTDTTFAQIQQALADGIADGEGINQLADRVRHVFQVARSRAELIARTETTGAMNEAAHTYAASLPAGAVGRKEWLAVHDERTRMTHRVADGQTVPMWSPFVVGSSLMMHPGDPSAPPDEVCNCRCSLLYHPGSPADSGGINPIGV